MTFGTYTGRQSWTPDELDTMVHDYLTSALWSSTGEDGEPLDARYKVADIDPATVEAQRAEVIDFYRANRRLLCAWWTPGQAGHDFWLTRNGHGAGFWDRKYYGANNTPAYRRTHGLTSNQARGLVRFNAACDRLSADAKVWGTVDLYEGEYGGVFA